MTKRILAALSALLLVSAVAHAAEPVKIGMVTTLSTPAGYLGEDIRDGFQIALDQGKGALGGVPAELVVADDGANPSVSKELVVRMLQSDRIKVFTGAVFSQTTFAIQPEILRSGGYFVSANSAPIDLDGANCHAHYFVASWHNTGQFEAAAAAANAGTHKKMLVLVANFNAGREAVTHFRKNYTGEALPDMLVKFNQTDFAAEISQIRAMKPDAIFTFLPGGMGVSFLRQLKQAGMKDVKLYSGMTVDSRLMHSVGDAAIGSIGSTFWNADFSNATSRKFVEDFEKRFGRTPTTYAAQGYESAKLIGSALEASGGKVDADAFRAALRAAKFDSIRGDFSFAADQHPIQDWYETEIIKGADGKPAMRTVRKLLSSQKPPLADDCKRIAAR